MATKNKTQARIVWAVILTALAAVIVGWVVYDALPRPVKGQIGLVPKVDRFSYSSWRSELDLSKDSAGDATLTVTETLVARFPDRDQNKGIVRGIPTKYRSAIDDVSVTDGDGNSVPYTTEFDYENNVYWILTGNDDYVRGEQTYVIHYTFSDAMVSTPTSAVQELYWNLLPLDSAQAIDRFSATIRVDPSMADALNGDSACYQGRFGSTDRCTLTSSTAADGAQVYEIGSGPRLPGDGVTIAIGFEPGTVNNILYQGKSQPGVETWLRSWADRGAFGVLLVLVGLAISGLALRHHTRRVERMTPDQPAALPPVPAAGVPTTLPPPVAAAILNSTREDLKEKITPATAGQAEIIHLAVQGVIRLEQNPEAKGKPVVAHLVAGERAVHRLDQEMLEVVLPAGAVSRELPKKDASFADAVRKVGTRGLVAALQQGYLVRPLGPLNVVVAAIAILLGIAGGIIMVIGTIGGFTLFLGIVALIAQAVLAFALLRPDPVLTQRGQAAHAQLLGVEAHVDDRPSRDRLSDADPELILQMERVLPYAILFGQSNSWGTALASAYQGTGHQPLWVAGHGDTFDFHRTWTNLDRTTRSTSSYVPPSSSSSSGGGGYSGGSSGGGFSGGGGGGGFSGGR